MTTPDEGRSPLALIGRTDIDGSVVIDVATLDSLGEALGLDTRDVAVWVRSLIEEHQPLAVFEMRSGAWRVELVPAVAKSVLIGLVAATALQLLGAASIPVVVLAMAAGLFMSVQQVDIAEADVVVHVRLHEVVGDIAERSLADLYGELPADARAELSFGEFTAMALRLHEIGWVGWTAAGVRLRAAGAKRGFRLVARRPSTADIAAQLRTGTAPTAADQTTREQRIFVIHGRDDAFVGRMFEFFSLLGLRPMEWEPLVAMAHHGPAPTLHDVIKNGLREAQAVVALLTPDDVVQLHPELCTSNEDQHELVPACQPRPNVLMELGVALYAYRQQTIVVKVGSIRPIADLAGINFVAFDGKEAARAKLVQRLKLAGCAVDDRGTEWRRQGRFDDLSVFKRGPG